MTYIGAEVSIIDSWVAARLAATPSVVTLVGSRIFNTYAPPDIDFPFIIFQQQTLRDVRGVGSERIMVDTLYVVKGIGQGSDFSQLGTLAAAIDTALNVPAGGAATGGLVLASVRDEPFALTEVEDGKQFRHMGGVYRIYAQAT
jgi:Protein of unknown function (DUF3168)